MKMENNLQGKVDKFLENFSTIKDGYKWSIQDLSLRFIALVYSLSDKTFDKEEFDTMTKYIKKNSKLFSHYRGHQKYSTAALLVTKFDNPEEAFDSLLEYDEKMKDMGFKNSPYLSIASYALLLTSSKEDVDNRINRAMEIYKEMKSNHFWLTSTDDYPVSILLSQSDEDKDKLISNIEENYKMLHNEGLSRGNGMQFLSHLLTFVPGSSNIKAHKVKGIYDSLKEEKLKVSSTYYGVLGYLSLLGEFSNQATLEVIEVVKYLKSKKNFKWVNKDMNILIATALVTNEYMDKLTQGNELIETGIGISIETMIAAQTAALIAAMSASTAASASASAGN